MTPKQQTIRDTVEACMAECNNSYNASVVRISLRHSLLPKLLQEAEQEPQAPVTDEPINEIWEFSKWWETVHQVIGRVAAWEAWKARAALQSATAESVPVVPEWFCDEDEYEGKTLDEYIRQRGKLVIGDEFNVTAVFTEDRRYRIVGGGPTQSADTAFITEQIAAPTEAKGGVK